MAALYQPPPLLIHTIMHSLLLRFWPWSSFGCCDERHCCLAKSRFTARTPSPSAPVYKCPPRPQMSVGPAHARLAELTYFLCWFGFVSGTLDDRDPRWLCVAFGILAQLTWFPILRLVSILLTSFASALCWPWLRTSFKAQSGPNRIQLKLRISLFARLPRLSRPNAHSSTAAPTP